MPEVNGDAAIAWMRAKVTNVPGSCLNTIWQAYGSHNSTGPHAGQYPDAINGWWYATKRHPGDTNPPAGFPVYFDALSRPRYAGDTNYRSGDIVLSIGGGNVICTDGAGAGRIAVMTIAQRARQIGRTYLGWTEDFLGYDVVTSTRAASLSATTITDEPAPPIRIEDDMPALLHLVTTYKNAKGVPDQAYIYKEGPLLDAIDGHYLAALQRAYPDIKLVEVNEYDYNAVKVETEKLRSIVSGKTVTLQPLPDEEMAKTIAIAVADEQAKRMQA